MKVLWDDGTVLPSIWRAFVRDLLVEWNDLIPTARYPNLRLTAAVDTRRRSFSQTSGLNR